MRVRPARFSDREKIALTHKASIEALCAEHYGAQEIAGWVRVISPAIYSSAIQEKIMIVAEDDDQILGLGILDIQGQEVSAVYIHPKANGSGIGKKLLAELEKRAVENGLGRLSLCSTTNAKGFYEKCGYAGSETGCHELPNGVKLECIRMRKTLTTIPDASAKPGK